MKNSLSLYFHYIGLSLRGQMQYKASFIMMSIGHFFITIIDFLGIWILFERFNSLQGWTLPEIALFYGMVSTAFAFAEAWPRGFDTFHNLVRTGDFDRILLRPRTAFLQIIGQEFQLMRIGRLIQGIIILVWATITLSISWTFYKIILLILSIFGGMLIFSGLFILQATLSFWSIQSLEILNMVTYGGVETLQYPLSIYRNWFRNFFTYVIPLAFINYIPALNILDKGDKLMNRLSWLSAPFGLLFFLICIKIWHFGIRHYRSTGS
ncbi:ABC transporter permease [Natronospora cellulosivora (SeqCode)]